MRVISGSAKGKNLKYPKLSGGKRIRPLSDMAKQALFNILINKIEGCDFLDLFAGTGQVGIEALSRGARLAIFIEKDNKAIAVIRENLAFTALSERAEVYSTDVLKGIGILDRNNANFNVIFIGAPYGLPDLENALEKIGKSGIVKEDGIVVAEHSKRQKINDIYGNLFRIREEKYGDTVFAFYKIMGGAQNFAPVLGKGMKG